MVPAPILQVPPRDAAWSCFWTTIQSLAFHHQEPPQRVISGPLDLFLNVNDGEVGVSSFLCDNLLHKLRFYPLHLLAQGQRGLELFRLPGTYKAGSSRRGSAYRHGLEKKQEEL